MLKVIHVTPHNNYLLQLTFSDNAVKFFDVKPFMNKGIFKELMNVDYFKKVCIKFDSIAWPNDQDFSPDTLYILGKEKPE